MPAHTVKTETTTVYSGSEMTAEEKQEAANRAAQAVADYAAEIGKGVLSSEGVLPSG